MGVQPWFSYGFLIIAVAFLIALVIWIFYSMKRTGDTARERREVIISRVLFVIAGIPLPLYPFVLIANAMSFDAWGTGGQPALSQMAMILLLMALTTAYPVTYLICLMIPANSAKRFKLSFVPIAHLIIVLLIVFGAPDGAKTEAGQYGIYSVNIYQNTSAWDLAQAVRNQNTNKIAEIAKSKPKLLEYHDPIYGTTLLIWAVETQKYDAAEALLKAGANPNATALKRGGETALHVAVSRSDCTDLKYIKLILKYGANPNIGLVSNWDDYSTETGQTPLMYSIGCGIEKTKALVDGGANINARTPTGMTAAIGALTLLGGGIKDNQEYAHYLIAEKHADVTNPWLPKPDPPSAPQRRIEPVTLLRDWTPELDSEGYRMKMDIVKEFARQGVDYWKTEIPKDVVKHMKKAHPDTWQEYLKKY